MQPSSVPWRCLLVIPISEHHTIITAPTAKPISKPVPPATLVVENAAAGFQQSASWIGDGACDNAINSEDFGFDGGDCCRSTCIPYLSECPAGRFDCKDPVALAVESCPVKRQKNGKCNVGVRNTTHSYCCGLLCACGFYPVWIFGTCIFVSGSLLNFGSYAFAPQVMSRRCNSTSARHAFSRLF